MGSGYSILFYLILVLRHSLFCDYCVSVSRMKREIVTGIGGFRMAKKNRKDPGEIFEKFDPQIEKLAMERLLSGKQIFNYRTKRLHKHIRDEVQARGLLSRAQMLARELGKELVLRSQEKRLLQQIFKTTIIAFGFFVIWLPLMDQDGDGVEDTIEYISHWLSQVID